MIYEDYDVFASYIKDGEPYEESVGEVCLHKLTTSQDHPEYLEIDGVCYYPQH